MKNGINQRALTAARTSECNDTDDSSDEDTCPASREDPFSGVGYRLVSLLLLFAAIHKFCACKSCKSGSVIVKEGKRNGLATTVIFSCSECEAEESVALSPELSGAFFLLFLDQPTGCVGDAAHRLWTASDGLAMCWPKHAHSNESQLLFCAPGCSSWCVKRDSRAEFECS